MTGVFPSWVCGAYHAIVFQIRCFAQHVVQSLLRLRSQPSMLSNVPPVESRSLILSMDVISVRRPCFPMGFMMGFSNT